METLQRTANRGSISTGPYEIDNSIMFTTQGTYADSGSYFWDLIASSEGWAANSNAGTNARKCTVSAWVKRTALTESSHYPRIFSYRAGGVAFDVFFDPTSDQLTMYDDNTSMSLKTNRSFRDTASFYHIIVAVDQTQSTASNRVKVYVNGVQETSWATEDYGNQNVDLSVFRAAGTTIYVGGAANDASAYFNGYISEYNFIDGQQLAPTEFGEFDDDTGIWIPKKFTGSYGTLGHFYNFTVANDMGKDFSGNGNDSNNRGDGITNGAARQATDTPTNNFCTLNPLSAGGNRGNVISEGATKVVIENSGQQVAVGTMAVTKGKWYWEAKHTSGTYQLAGIISADSRVSGNGGVADSSVAGSDAVGLYRPNGYVYYNGTGTAFDTNSYSNGDIIGVALDMDNGTCALYEDGVLMGNAGSNDIVAKSGHASLTGAWTAMYSDGTNGTFNITYEVNFGGYHTYTISSGNTDENGYGNFEYAPPSGYYALCSRNLSEYG